MKKKIIFFCPSIEKGGVEKNFFLIINSLSNLFNVELITASNIKSRINSKINCTIKSPKFIHNFPRFFKSIYCFVFSLIRLNKKILLISFESNIFAVLAAKIIGAKVIIRSNASPKGYLNFLKKNVFKFFFQKADLVLVNSYDFKKNIDKIFKINSKVIYNSLENSSNIKKLSSRKVKLNYKSNSKEFRLISIGRLVPQKDHLTLLKALNLLKKKINFQLIIIGNGKLRNNLEEFCIKNQLIDKVKFLGYKPNIYPYLKWSDALVLSSLFEGSPNVILEAISMKKLVISSNCETGPKEILQNGLGGYLFKTSNYKDLAKKIEYSFLNKKKNRKKIDSSFKTLYKYQLNNNLNNFINLINQLK